MHHKNIEFQLIHQYFSKLGAKRKDVLCGIGDDGAILQAPSGQSLVMTMDTLNAGVHFELDISAEDLAYKALAVNLSDLAAMGATPAWILLSLTLPEIDDDWCEDFCRGLQSLLEPHHIALIGGDTTRGALSVAIQATGFLPEGKKCLRSGAHAGDLILVSGTLGDASAALYASHHDVDWPTDARAILEQRLRRPTPRLALGQAMLGKVNAAIDISDGLFSELHHLAADSQKGMRIDLSQLPISDALKSVCTKEEQYHHALMGGDDYELCLTAAPETAITLINDFSDLPLTCIGEVTHGKDVLFFDGETQRDVSFSGFQHFVSTQRT